jgi:cytochrome c
LSLACVACHHLRAGAGHSIGPNLYGIFGSPAGVQPDFRYSDALRNAEIVWTPGTIDAWLKDPTGFVPGNNMPFFGYGAATDRRDLIAYLMSETGADLSRDWPDSGNGNPP